MIKGKIRKNKINFSIVIVLLISILNACSSEKTSKVAINTASPIITTLPLQTPDITSSQAATTATVAPKVTTPPLAQVTATTVPQETGNKSTLPEYFIYNGGELPEDIIKPIEYIVRKKISSGKPEFRFEIYGDNVQSYGLTANKDKYYIAHDDNKIKRIVISCDDINYHQELKFAETITPNTPGATYGFSLDDWNFDGYLDISLWISQGGTSLNSPHYYWLWDNDKNKYVSNSELEYISESTSISLNVKSQLIFSDARLTGMNPGNYTRYYEWREGKPLLIKSEETTYETVNNAVGKIRVHHLIKELIDGKMQVTKDYYEEK